MATIGWIKVGLTTDTTGLASGLKSSGSMLDTFVGKLGAVGVALAGAFAAQKIAGGLMSMVSTASDLSENMNKVEAIFGSGSKTVIDASNAMAKAFGTSKNEFLDSAGRMGGLFKGAGMSQQAAASLSVEFTKLAGDAASFFNTDFETAFMKIRSGLSGESEPLKDFGILMTEDAVKAKAYAMGLAKVGTELTSLMKVQARAALISQGLADAEGDLERTSGGVANASRALWGRIENLAGSIGQAFLPVVEKALGFANQFLGAIGEWVESSGIITTIGDLIDSLIVTPIQFVIGLFRLVGDVLGITASDLVGIFTGLIQLIASTIKAVASLLKMFTYGGATAVDSVTATAKKIPKAATASAVPTKAAKKNADQYASAVEFGSAEAYTSILASRAQQQGGIQDRVATNTQALVEQGKIQISMLRRIVEGSAEGRRDANLASSLASV
jgi:hypothetical protein